MQGTKNLIVSQVRQLPMWEESLRAIYSVHPNYKIGGSYIQKAVGLLRRLALSSKRGSTHSTQARRKGGCPTGLPITQTSPVPTPMAG